jgi:hypothetical protein
VTQVIEQQTQTHISTVIHKCYPQLHQTLYNMTFQRHSTCSGAANANCSASPTTRKRLSNCNVLQQHLQTVIHYATYSNISTRTVHDQFSCDTGADAGTVSQNYPQLSEEQLQRCQHLSVELHRSWEHALSATHAALHHASDTTGTVHIFLHVTYIRCSSTNHSMRHTQKTRQHRRTYWTAGNWSLKVTQVCLCRMHVALAMSQC